MKYLIKGKLYNPIKVGDSQDWYFGREHASCGDCGAQHGHFHTENCDIERCPCCGGQLISCNCGIIYSVSDIIPSSKLKELIERQKLLNKPFQNDSYYYESSGPTGNIYCILYDFKMQFKKTNRELDFYEMESAVKKAKSYSEALSIINKYVKLIDLDKQIEL